jgi:hypothetical protein
VNLWGIGNLLCPHLGNETVIRSSLHFLFCWLFEEQLRSGSFVHYSP